MGNWEFNEAAWFLFFSWICSTFLGIWTLSLSLFNCVRASLLPKIVGFWKVVLQLYSWDRQLVRGWEIFGGQRESSLLQFLCCCVVAVVVVISTKGEELQLCRAAIEPSKAKQTSLSLSLLTLSPLPFAATTKQISPSLSFSAHLSPLSL